MSDSSGLSPDAALRASRFGVVPGIVLVLWGAGFWQMRPHLAPVVFWVTWVAVALLIVAVPSWWAGQRAKRAFVGEREQAS
jgi:hypothetical protein